VGESRVSRRCRAVIISTIIAVRVICAVLFLYTFHNDLRLWALCLFLCACFTDAIDGYLARVWAVSPSLGAYFDAGADFFLTLMAFSAFVIKGIYPFWTLAIISAMFLQFVLTSGLRQPLYDPVGKYYGVFLYSAIGITLAFPQDAIYNGMPVIISAFTIISAASRFVFLLKHHQQAGPHP